MTVLSLAEALAELPDTADGIAAMLTEKGIRGERRRAACCPVANYLVGVGFEEASVGPTQIEVWSDDGDIDPDEMEAVTPWWVTEFIIRFDGGEWPELVLNDTAVAS